MNEVNVGGRMYDWKPLPMNPRTSMGWGQALHSGMLCRRKDGKQGEKKSKHEWDNEDGEEKQQSNGKRGERGK